MTDEIWKRAEIQSPCQKICVMHPGAAICVGCNRTTEEITNWMRYSDEERRAIMADLPNRGGELKKRRGGRKARVQAPSATKD